MLWIRYIDDIYVFGHTGYKNSENLKPLNQSIKFETDISETEAHVLDITIKLKNGLIKTLLYT